MKEKKEIIVDEKGVRVQGFDSEDVLPYLIEAICHVWDRDVGPLDIRKAGMKVIDALHAAEMENKLEAIWDVLMDDDDDEEDEEDDEDE